MNKKEGETVITLRDVWTVFLKRWWIMLIVTVLCAAIVGVYLSCTYVPMYKSTAKMYVNNDNSSNAYINSISSSDIMAAQALVNTYCVILKSRTTLEEVIQKAELECSYEKLLSMVDCGSVNDTEVMYISVTASDPEMAKAITNGIVKVLSEQIAAIIDGSSVKTVDEAVKGKEVSSGISQKVALTAAIAILLSFAFFFIYDVLVNDTLNGEDWIIETFGGEVPLLAVVPDVNEERPHGRYGYYKRHGYYTSNKAD